jgi:anti-sigma factor RsiW
MNESSRAHPGEEQLHDLVDGFLSAESRDWINAHIDQCAACAETVTQIRALRMAVVALPPRIDPPENLWPAIQDQIRQHSPVPVGSIPTTRPMAVHGRGRSIGWLAAAAVLLVAASSLTTFLVFRTDRIPVVAETSASLREPPAPITIVNGDYERVERDLAALLDSQRKTLQPETIAKVERNLAIIDAAIAEIRQALAGDPTNRALHDLLRASYGQKAALIQQVSRT